MPWMGSLPSGRAFSSGLTTSMASRLASTHSAIRLMRLVEVFEDEFAASDAGRR